MSLRSWLPCLVVTFVCLASAQSAEVTSVGQSVADELRGATGADLAFVPMGVLVSNASGDLAGHMQYPTDTVAVIPLTGKQIKAAIERGVSIYPTANPAFLFVSGLTYTFKGSGAADARVSSISLDGSPLDAAKTYKVAMPANIAKGGLGFFTIWNRKALPTTAGMSLEAALKGKPVTTSSPRWVASS